VGLTAFPDLRITVEGTVAEGDEVVVRWSVRGTHLGDGLGFPTTGRAVAFRGMRWIPYSGGKMVRGLGLLKPGRAHPVAPRAGVAAREMVREGMAWWYRKYAPDDTELERLEADARAAKRGLWSQPNPVPPWQWRHGNGVPRTAAVIGNRRSKVYHKATCRGAATTAAKNRVTFASGADAEKAGYRKAGDCW
jgi:hypothetical protein